MMHGISMSNHGLSSRFKTLVMSTNGVCRFFMWYHLHFALHIYSCAICLNSLVGCFQAEIAMRADGKPGMSDEEVEIYVYSFSKKKWKPITWCFRGTLPNIFFPHFSQVKDFVSRYLPAYKAYLPTLYSEGPSGSDPEHVLLIDIDEGRNPILGC